MLIFNNDVRALCVIIVCAHCVFLGGFNFSVGQISATIQSFKSTPAGPDGISIKTLKLLPGHFASYLYLIFSCSLATSEIPIVWKNAVITPVPKPGDKSEPDNYRPISIT